MSRERRRAEEALASSEKLQADLKHDALNGVYSQRDSSSSQVTLLKIASAVKVQSNTWVLH